MLALAGLRPEVGPEQQLRAKRPSILQLRVTAHVACMAARLLPALDLSRRRLALYEAILVVYHILVDPAHDLSRILQFLPFLLRHRQHRLLV